MFPTSDCQKYDGNRAKQSDGFVFCSYLWNDRSQKKVNGITYVFNNQLEINLKTSKSDLVVSSKPGVSTMHKFRPGNGSLTTEISLVKD